MHRLPLTNKKMQRLNLPYIQVGVCEMMNLSQNAFMDSFNVYNTKNSDFFSLDGQTSEGGSTPAKQRFLGDVVGGGLCNSYTGAEVCKYISNFISRALSMHTLVPDEIHRLKKEFGAEDPVTDYLLLALRERKMSRDNLPKLRSLFTETDMQQYAFLADSSFFKACKMGSAARRDGPLVEEADASTALSATRIEETGCRAAWFTATVSPIALEAQRRVALLENDEAKRIAPPPQKSLGSTLSDLDKEMVRLEELRRRYPFSLDVLVSGVGDCRAFGISRNEFSERGKKSQLDPTRERVVPLSMDHKPLRTVDFRRIIAAGGKVDSEQGEIIDGNPFYNVSRSFGHLSMKSNSKLSPMHQKLIPLPSTYSWEMLPGDVLVLTNHAIFETRNDDDTSMDELAKLVAREVGKGSPPEQVAGALCDFAVRFGAEHSLQAMVVVAQGPQGKDGGDGAVEFNEWVEPGPLYPYHCQLDGTFRKALLRDCARCNCSLEDLLRLRYERVKDILPLRHELSLLPYYSKEMGALQSVMDEEYDFFEADTLQNKDINSPEAARVFARLASQLQPREKQQK